MTFMDGDYEVQIIAKIPSDPNTDSYTATHMWLREYATKLREAARLNDEQGFYFAAANYRTTANNITEALAILEDSHARSK